MAFLKVLGVLLLSSSYCLAFGQSQENLVEPVRAALQAGDSQKAVELSRAALQKEPNNAQLWTFQGIAFAQRGQSQDALGAFRHALQISPNNIAALAGSAQILYQAGDQSAVPLLNRLLQVRPGDPTANAMLAVLDFQRGDCPGAVAHFSHAGGLINSQLDALHAYATCLARLKRFDDAASIEQKAVALAPQDLSERRVLASIQLLARQPKAAVETLQPLLESQNTDVDTLELASRAYEDAGDTPRAVSTLRQALLREPRRTSLYLDFATICFNHQSFQVGVDIITEGLTLQPSADDLYIARGVLYVQLAQYDKAEADFEKAYALNPKQSLSIAAQGLTAVQANDLDHAFSSIQEKLKKKPNDPLLLYLQADLLSQKGIDPGTPAFDLALRSAKRAVALQPSLSSAHTVLAKLYMQTAQYPEVIAQCRKALSIDPQDQSAVYHLIQALRKTGDQKDIPELLQRLAKLREDATQQERERYRYKLYVEEPPPHSGHEP